MTQLPLTVAKRTISGKKVKKLRAQGKIPANVFGKNTKSMGVEVGGDLFAKIYDEAGETKVIELTVGDEKKPVLIQNVQVHPVTATILHVDFRQVDLREKIKAQIPIELTGESPVITEKSGVVLQLLNEIEVEALPTELPEKIEVDTTKLLKVGDVIIVSELSLPKSVAVLESPDSEVVKVAELVVEEEVAPATESTEEATAEGETVAGEETKDASEKEPTDLKKEKEEPKK